MPFFNYLAIIKVEIETEPIEYADCSNCLRVQICQNENCCTTPILSELSRGSTKSFSQCNIGNCKGHSIDTTLPIQLNFKHETGDGWKGVSATVFTTHHSKGPYKCFISKWLDSDDSDYESTYETTCNAPVIVST